MQLFVLPNTSANAATNMAIDASLLVSVPEESAIFRHYGWTEPAITFGYTQRINEIKTVVTDNICLCRRITGGGIVDHRDDWTYALVLHAHLSTAQNPATELYAAIHKCIQQALATQSITTHLAPCPRACEQASTKPSAGPGQCFLQPAANDVLHPDGKKIAGAAMKRTRNGLLVQGSIDRRSLPTDFDFENFSIAFQKELSGPLNLSLSKQYTGLSDENHVQQERQRFESDSWKNRR